MAPQPVCSRRSGAKDLYKIGTTAIAVHRLGGFRAAAIIIDNELFLSDIVVR